MSQNLSSIPWLNKNIKIAVVGDIMLDEYLEGSVDRISPEAPVPIHRVRNHDYRAGGAANVALNIQSLGGQSLLFGIWGEDDASEILGEILESKKVDYTGVLSTPDRPTTRKTRVAANKQQMLRIDWEDSNTLSNEQESQLLKQLSSTTDVQALVVSDYGKGCLSDAFLSKLGILAESKKWISIVDPKGTDFTKYAPFDMMTPNHAEACRALGISKQDNTSPESICKRLQKKYNLQSILLTLGSQGMHFQPSSSNTAHKELEIDGPIHIEARKVDVFDVSGAGDTVVATTIMGLASRLEISDVMSLANIAAGKVVERWGTYALTMEELHKALQNCNSNGDYYLDKHMSLQDFLNGPRKGIESLVFTNGCFDVLHAGHTRYLQAARKLGSTLVLGLNSDDSISRLKGSDRPIHSFEHRAEVLSALAMVDYIIKFDSDTPLELIESIVPDILVKGSDYSEAEIVGAEFVRKHGGDVKTVDLVKGLSTTQILNRS